MAHSATSAMEPAALRLNARPDLPVILYSPKMCAKLQPCIKTVFKVILPVILYSPRMCAKLQPCIKAVLRTSWFFIVERFAIASQFGAIFCKMLYGSRKGCFYTTMFLVPAL